ncbi:glycosyltransferase family 2 protein [Paraburkholderia sacchari]|uniref:glycosyltransferase family 2 protein n=1 Tax=Paraburkholderia sacchari TaxID=159450 RepID=UPI001BD05A16|nr:glycosyltransferase family 2 protein [Paraburkholderia sacchari]
MTANDILSLIVHGIVTVILTVNVLQNALYLFQIVAAIGGMIRPGAKSGGIQLWRRYGASAPPIALLAPAYNEELGIVDCVKALFALEYPLTEVIVINDGSTDNTLGVLTDAFELTPTQRTFDAVVTHKLIRGIYVSRVHPNLLVIDKENGGKADAMNAGINLARAPLFCAIDSDSLLESDALLRIVRPFVEDPQRTVAVGGVVRVANGCRIQSGRVVEMRAPRRFLPLVQSIEYLRAFLLARVAWSGVDALMLISGAFGLFRRDVVVQVGGFGTDTIGEDLDLVIKIHRHLRDQRRPYNIAFLTDPICWTEAPQSLRVLKGQRCRWQRGALEVFFKQRDMLFRSDYGRIGWLGMGQILIVDVLGPLAELSGYIMLPAFWALAWINVSYLKAFLSLVFLFGMFLSVSSLVLAELATHPYPRLGDLLRLALAAVVENFGYRQLNSYWRMLGWWQFLRKDRSWGVMTRVGFNTH